MSGLITQALAYAQFRKKEIVSTGELVSSLKISPNQERDLFSRLEKKGSVVRLKRGVYLFPLQLPPNERFNVDELKILSSLMRVEKSSYQISGQFAFQNNGLDEQIPNQIHVYNDRVSGKKTIGGFRFVFIKTSASRLLFSQKITMPGGNTLFVATKAKALVDAFYDWSIFNTIPKAFDWLMNSCGKDAKLRGEVIKVAAACGNRSTVQRIGCLLEKGGVKDRRFAVLQKYLGKTKSLIPLDPFNQKRGTIDKSWGVIINVDTNKNTSLP